MHIDYIGGNVFIYLSGVTSWKHDSAVLIIESCTIASGCSTYPQIYSPGLEIHVSEFSSSTDIKIINSQISLNMLKYQNRTGDEAIWVHPGNAVIHLFPSIQNTSRLIEVETAHLNVE